MPTSSPLHHHDCRLDTARILKSFIASYIDLVEITILGGEFGKSYCHEKLTANQAVGLISVLRSFSKIWARLQWKELTRDNVIAHLTQGTKNIIDTGNEPESTILVLRQSVEHLPTPRFKSTGTSTLNDGADVDGEQQRAEQALDVVHTIGRVYFESLTAFAESSLSPDGSLNPQALYDVAVWVDTGLGINHVLCQHYVDRCTSAAEFVLGVKGQLQRTTWEEASNHAVWQFDRMVDQVLEEVS
jgi:hypothetical protein